MTASALSAEVFSAARARIRDRVHLTPIESATLIGETVGVRLYFKCENLQKTGSFKPRGALNNLLQLDEAAHEKGVVTVSAGNHAQALAWAARVTGTRCTVVMPEKAAAAKVEASRDYGAEVILHGDAHAAFEKAHALEADRNLTFVHPFDDERIVAGAGSAGLEILEQLDGVTAIIVPIGGGGLIGGIAAAVKLNKPTVKVYGVEPDGAAAMRKSLDAGSAVHLDRIDTVADGLAAPMAGDLNYEIVKQYVDDVVTVSDQEIIQAMGIILSRAKLLTEPAGAASTAALLNGRLPVKPHDRVVAVLSGGNVALERLVQLLDGGL